MQKKRHSEEKTVCTKNSTPNNGHWAVFIDNSSNKSALIDAILSQRIPKPFDSLKGLKGALFSKLALLKLLNKERRHGVSDITVGTDQSLQTMSSGEQKKALLSHLLKTEPDFLILDNPFDNLDKEFQMEFKALMHSIRTEVRIIQIISRTDDLLSFVTNYYQLKGKDLVVQTKLGDFLPKHRTEYFIGTIPPPLKTMAYKSKTLVELKNINVSYGDRPILKDISWKIKRGEFWELSGKNGSGKTTILSMITGENPKGYGQELFLFGHKKGSGESVWDIKRNIGYFSPAMTDKFTGYHSVEHMMISGILDSVGLYVRPTEAQLRLAKEWLLLIDLWHLKDTLFHDLSMGQKRLVMTTRAMIKHPLLLILDEPTAGLDDGSAAMLVTLVNKMAKESNTTIIFVSHRPEPGLKPRQRLVLKIGAMGSTGILQNH